MKKGNIENIWSEVSGGNYKHLRYDAGKDVYYYDELEKELENKIADVIREFKNTYSVLPFLKIENSENVKVSLEMNRYTINPRTLYNQILEHQKDHQ